MAFYDPVDYLMNRESDTAKYFGSPLQPQKAPDPIAAATSQTRVPVSGSFFPAANLSTVGSPSPNGRFQFGPGSFRRFADDRSDLNDLLNQSPETRFLGKPNTTPTPTPTPVPASRLTMDRYRDRYGWTV